MTALSCFAIGVAFALAVGLLIFAGVTIGCLLPPRLRFAQDRFEGPGFIDPPGEQRLESTPLMLNGGLSIPGLPGTWRRCC